MATATRGKSASWKRPGSPIGWRGPRKANPKYKRNSREPWGRDDIQTLKQLAQQNTPTRVIGLKLGRTEIAVRGKAQRDPQQGTAPQIVAIADNRDYCRPK